MMHAAYFEKLGSALKAAGYFRPTLVIDRARLDANVAVVKATLPKDRALRLVDKSLSSLPLLAYLMGQLQTRRIMSFHLPIARTVLAAFSDAELLFGKPMPADAIRTVFARAEAPELEAFSARVVHLADSVERLRAYAQIAHETGRIFRFAAEINVGMNRGGFDSAEQLRSALLEIVGNPLMKCEGIMGYEAHLHAIPGFAGGASAERPKVVARYQQFLDVLRPDQRQILNTGGSHTALSYGKESASNEVSMGSALLLPTDFDGGDLAGFQPAFFIATPVLKIVEARIPGPAWLTSVMQTLGKFPHRACYLYGGKWMAKPVFPPDLQENALWGRSSNQQFFSLASNSTLKPDDFAFLRPTQSEAVLQQFGPLAIYEDGRIVGEWQPIAVG